MGGHDLGDLLSDHHRRVQRRHRVLEDHADLVASHLAQLGELERDQISAVEANLAAGDEPAPREQPHDRHRGHRLAAAGLADDAHRLARFDLEAQAVDGMNGPAPKPDLSLEVLDLEESRHASYLSCRRTSKASWRASPMKLKATTVMTIMIKRRVHLPPVPVLQIRGAVGQHRAPGGRGRRQTEAEVLEHSQRQDRVGDLERDRDHDHANRVRDDVAGDDAPGTTAHDLNGLHVLACPQG